ncbi:hypothetical protein ACFLUZ_03770 [Chloroflexota bacterium]
MDVSPGGGGIVRVNENVSSSYPVTSDFPSGSSVVLEAIPASGYRFDNWNGDLADTINPTSIDITCNKNITANFSQVKHTLTMQVSGSGSVTPITGTHVYSQGTIVSIKATPDNGWQFDGWTGDVSDTSSATTTVTMVLDKTVAANFSQVKHTLTMQVSGGGSATPITGTHVYSDGAVVSVTAIPDNGWQFDGWTGDVSDANSATTTVIMALDKTVAANFSQVKANWSSIVGIVTGAIIIGLVILLIVRSRTA